MRKPLWWAALLLSAAGCATADEGVRDVGLAAERAPLIEEQSSDEAQDALARIDDLRVRATAVIEVAELEREEVREEVLALVDALDDQLSDVVTAAEQLPATGTSAAIGLKRDVDKGLENAEAALRNAEALLTPASQRELSRLLNERL